MANDTAKQAEGKRAYLEIRDVVKKFGEFTALKDISLDIFEGEFVCFLGPSGCGKTTLLRAIAGLDIQTSGRIVQAGRDISALPPSERDFGIVFQSYALFPNLTVRRNVAYGLENRRRPKAEVEARVKELLALVGLPDQGDKYPAQLSGGQQQRVALARALATSPGLLLLDEPLSALDAKVRMHLRHEVRQLQNKLGVTTIMVTHDQEEALTMADRIVVMNHGVIEQVGTPEEIYGHPASPFVADFVGTMNFIEAVAAGEGRIRLDGVELTARGAEGIAAGTPVTLCVRPEDVVARGVSGSTPNSFDAEVQELEFLGSFFRAYLRAAGVRGTEISADFSVNLVRDLGIREGMTARLALPTERILVFAGRAGAARAA
ncbi:MAG: putative 2-aminoethylphosphonate ABC transporter ATP-binding protein [Alphaproteobacteria bacterium]|nr:putative 2-aminoethylphosphonate ABC transporter ATP-binding protein [Alphaproteobacteria bacterium]